MTALSNEKTTSTDVKKLRTILVCEDDEGIRDLLVEALQEAGYTVDSASNGMEALEHLQQGDGRSLVLLDLLMPDVTGYEILERMNVDPQLRGEHVIVIVSATGLVRPVSPGVTEKQLVKDFLKKPFELDDLLAMVQRWV